MDPTLETDTTDRRRFETGRMTLLIDRVMTWLIRCGGVLVVTVVFGIFLFILFQVFPLFQAARVHELKTVQLPQKKFTILGVDEWGAKPFLVEPDGNLLFVDYASGQVSEIPVDFGGGPAHEITAAGINKREQKLIVGTADGKYALVSPGYKSSTGEGKNEVTASPTATNLSDIGIPGARILDIAYGDSGSQKLVVALQDADGKKSVSAQLLKRKRSLLGAGSAEVATAFDLTPFFSGQPRDILVPATGDAVIATTDEGEVIYLSLQADGGFQKVQTFQPFGDLADSRVALVDFLFGDVSLILAAETGENRVFSLFYPKGASVRTFGLTQEFPVLPGRPSYLVSTQRNKAFLIGAAREASLRFRTTTSVRWQELLPFTATKAVISGKYRRILFLDEQNRLHFYELNDPHPDSGWKALFGKIWYEGAPEKKWEWQSTGGSDDFEPKYSLVPLIFGTLKGTLYAMLFAVPIALLAALYTSQFLDPNLRGVIKPTMEIMASLPSVVLGFLAAIYIAPLVEHRIPSLMLLAAGLPAAAALFGWFWSTLPIHLRKRIRPGTEWMVFLPILALLGSLLWSLGPAFESLAFVTTDPATGKKVADFRYWWPAVTGTPFDQRNSLVVGFMMGFAVIPIIFTIAEDALSNVPSALRTASMACGASRWQTAMRVVLPTASAGIFSALMIGLGRAVGETMIVVMATGNTPIMEWNIFSGMRTLSANIAVELPEAPHHGTLYRTLFFGALLLFLLTFFVNTVAEVLRQHLREKYKTV